MLGQIRNARVNFKTGIFIVTLGLAFWGLFVYANITTFAPIEPSEADGDGGLDQPSPVEVSIDAPRDEAFPGRWASGLDCANAAAFQVHAYDDDFYVLRQAKCTNHEGPFLFLFIGEERALLMDTGAVTDADVYGTVMGILEARAADLGTPTVPLVVAHTHSHGDHTSADAQFERAAGVETVVGLSEREVTEFWGFTDWPNDLPTFDLGNRPLDVIAIPGHHGTSIALYDRRTRVLLTGDSVYPGHLFIPSAEAWSVARVSLERLVSFAEVNPVSWVLGNHIEVSRQPYEPYPYGAAAHADERALHFAPAKLLQIARALRVMGDRPYCVVYEDFVIHPTYVCGFDWNG